MKDELVKQICRVLEYSQNCVFSADEMRYIKNFVDEWYEKKRYFIDEWLNGKLIYELPEPVTFTLTEKEKQRQFENFIGTVVDYYGQSGLADFLSSLTQEEFYKNRFNKDFNYGSHKFLKGSKIVKSFKYFITRGSLISEIQDKASEIIQATKVTGTFCFSVHPLDFLSASENAHNWRSCHALDGDYRSGNMSYLLDDTTIMCYLKASDKDTYKLPHFPPDIPWNSKKWRMWLFFSDDRDLVMTGREYPFSSESCLEVIKKFFTSGRIQWTPWYDKFISEYTFGHDESRPVWNLKRYLPIGDNSLIAMGDLVQDYSSDPIYYNDLLLSEHYQPKWMYRIYDNYWYMHYGTSRHTRIKVGGEYHCPICGHEVTQGWNMFCERCNDENDEEDEDECFTCDICGRTYNVNSQDYAVLPLSGTLVCEDCYNDDEYLATCEKCGTRDVKEYINFNNDKDKKKCLCHSCRTVEEELPTDNNIAWIMPSNENRPIKITFEGNPIISSYDLRGEN